MIKFTILLRKNPAMTREEFVAHHRDVHAPLFKALPEVQQHVRRYVQCHTLDVSFPGFPPMAFDGITELWFDDLEGLGAVFNSEPYLATIRPDEERFLDLHGCMFVLSNENIVIS